MRRFLLAAIIILISEAVVFAAPPPDTDLRAFLNHVVMVRALPQGGGGISSAPIQFRNAGVTIGYPFAVNCSTNLTCTFANGVVTMTATGGGGGGGVTGCSIAGGVAFENGTANTLTCDANATWDNTNKTFQVSSPQAAIEPSLAGFMGAVNGINNITVATPSWVGLYGVAQNLAVGGSGPASPNGVFSAAYSNRYAAIGSGDVVGVGAQAIVEPPVGQVSGDLWGGSFAAYMKGPGTVPVAHGLGVSLAPVTGSMTTDGIGVNSDLCVTGGCSGTLVNYYQYYAPAFPNSAGTFHAAYWSGDQGTGAHDYAFYAVGGKSYFGGDLLLNASTFNQTANGNLVDYRLVTNSLDSSVLVEDIFAGSYSLGFRNAASTTLSELNLLLNGTFSLISTPASGNNASIGTDTSGNIAITPNAAGFTNNTGLLKSTTLQVNSGTTLNDLTASQCVGTDSSKKLVSNTNCVTSGGGGTPCTLTALSLQYNNAGAFGCVAQLTYSGSTITGASGTLDLAGMTLVKIPAATYIPGTQHGVVISGGSAANYVTIPLGTNGQILESGGPGVDPSFQDPIVSGPDAVAAAPTKNPVQIGCLYLTTPATLSNNQVGAAACDSGQRLLVDVAVAPSTAVTNTGTFAVQAAATLAAETTKVIGTVNQGTSPWVVSGALTDTQLRATPVPVSGAVTVTDGSGALNVIVDSGTTTVTQATGTNLHAVLDTTSTTAVTQATGTNLHAVLDTTSTTAVTQATAGNLNATVVGTGTFATQATLAAETTKVIGTVNQGTSPWVVTGSGGTFPVTGTFFQATQPVSLASATVASGAFASGSIASGAVASGAVASGAYAAGSIVDGADVTQGTKTDAKSTATDGTSTSVVSILKEISAMEQAPASRVVTQSTGTNLHAVLDTTSTTAVTQATGTNLHAVLDTTSTTAVTQATASNLNATVVGGTTPADGESNPTTAVSTEAHLMAWNNSTWDRLYAETNGNDAEAVRTTGNLSTENHPMVFNGTTWDRARTAGIGNNVASTGLPAVVPYCQSNTTLPTTASASYTAVQCDPFGRQIINDPKDDNIIAALTSLLQAQQNVRMRGTFGENIRSVNGALAVMPIQADPCSGIKQSIPISQTVNTKYLVGVGRRYYVCSIFLVGADAENVSIVEGTGTTCGTGTLAVIGGATAAAGPNMAANGGFTLGNGMGTIAASNIPGNDVCVFESGSGRVAGVMTVAFGQ